jgi:hypothetical protein
MVYSISYDLKKPGQDYEDLYKAIKGLGSNCHPLLSTWLVDCKLTPRNVYDSLSPYLDKNDLIFISAVTKSNYYGLLPKNCVEWLNEHVG